MQQQTQQSFSDFFLRAKGDLFYAFLLLLSALIALLLRQYVAIGARRYLDGLIGLSIAWFVAGPMILCSLLLVLAHLILLRVVKNPGFMANCSFYGTFAYLALLRTMHFAGLPPLQFVTNAIQLIITLRVIGLSYEVADMRTGPPASAEAGTFVRAEPTSLEAFNYLYSFTGLFTGPYFTYRTYSDALTRWRRPLAWPKLWPLLAIKARTLAWSLPALIFMTWLDPVNALRGDRLDSLGSLPWLFFWCALAFVHLRMRIYSAWMLAESICLLAGIGIYPRDGASEPGRGPKNLEAVSEMDWDQQSSVEFDAETIANLDIPRVEHSDGFRSGVRAWNRTVQFWLANFVYRRSSRAIRMPYTMLVSAFWHGIHPGYFLSFLTIPLCTAAEDRLFVTFPEANRPKWLQMLWSFVRMRGFESMAAGFLLLDGWDTLRLWARMYFWLHLTMLATLGLVWLYNNNSSRANRKDNGDGIVAEETETRRKEHMN